MNGYPPPLASLKSGEVLLLPLRPNVQVDGKHWKLLETEGVGITIPARAQPFKNAPDPQTGREFILGEMGNALSYGTAEEGSQAGGYVHNQYENLSPEMTPLLERYVADNKERWAAVLVDLMGHSRPNIADLRAGGWRDANWNPSADHGYSIATAVLRKLPDSPKSNYLLIEALMARSSSAPEFASLLAEECSNSDYFLSSLRIALAKRQPGAVFVACKVIGKNSVLYPYVQDAAREIVKTPATSNVSYAQRSDLDAAASLLAN